MFMFLPILILLLFCQTSPKANSYSKAVVLDVRKLDLQINQTDDFTFTNLDQKKALMINVEYSPHLSKIAELEVTMSNNHNQTIVCNFKYSNNLCVLQKITPQVKIKVRCLQKQCYLELSASQRTVISVKDKIFKRNLGLFGEIYCLQKGEENSILQIYSDRGEEKILSHQIQVYSNFHTFHLQTQDLNLNSAIFGLKPIKKDNDRYICIEHKSKNNDKLKITLKSHTQKLVDSVGVIDFIENYGSHSLNRYAYSGWKKNVQVDLKVFALVYSPQMPVTLKISGKVEQRQILIRQFKLHPFTLRGDKWFDYSFAISSSLLLPYSALSLQIVLEQMQDKALFFEIVASSVDLFQVDFFQQIHIGSSGQEELSFSVQPQVKMQLADGDKPIYIIKEGQGFTPNISICSLHDGCIIGITTEGSCQNCGFSFNLDFEDIRDYVIYYSVQNDTIQGKIDIEEQLYFKYMMAGNSSVQIVANTIDVIIYANLQNYQRCSKPTATCHQYIINRDNPVMVRNVEGVNQKLVVGIVGLEKTSFKVRFLNHQSVFKLKLGERFTYLMDNEENSLDLAFTLSAKQLSTIKRLHFNLISPIHSLKLVVTNQDGQTFQSYEGYVSFDKMHIKGANFKITIYKINQYLNEFVHFTFIIASNDLGVKLDSNTHYEKYAANQTKFFVIQYDSSRTNAINIYTQNLNKNNGYMELVVKDSQKTEDVKIIYSHSFTKDHQFINLDDELDSEEICGQKNCELEIQIRNIGDGAFQQSINLLTQETIIELDDSIWSTFEINELSVDNHFYFIPRNYNKSVTILFITDDNTLYITYRIFNTTSTISPIDWPFVHPDSQSKERIANTQEVIIQANDTELEACWPTCVVLLNLNTVKKTRNSSGQHSLMQIYKILATNTIIELPQDTKFQFTLAKDEEKSLFILAKSILMQEKLTFFTYYSLGRAKIIASLISFDKQFKLNKGEDFLLKDLQTKLQTNKISSIIQNEELNPQSVFIKINILAITDLKMTLEYSSHLGKIFPLRMDDLQTIILNEGQSQWYQFVPEKDFMVKLYRKTGLGLFKFVKCTQIDYVECFNKNLQWITTKKEELVSFQTPKIVQNEQGNMNLNKELMVKEGEQDHQLQIFVQKSYQFKGESCSDCIYYLWVYSYEQQLIMSANLRTSASQIQLQEMVQISDRLQYGQHHRYLINVAYERDTKIRVRAIEGHAQVLILDNTNTLLSQVINSAQHNQKEFVVTKIEEQQTKEDKLGQVRRADGQGVFRHIHVTISSITVIQLQYIISYSIGPSSLYLEDGLIVEKDMQANSTQTFYYHNTNKKQNAYLTLSSEILRGYEHLNYDNSMSVSFYYYPDRNNMDKREIFKPELPPNRNKKYYGKAFTNVYDLPAKYDLFQIVIQTKSAFLKVTASVSHQEMVFLILDFQYPVKLSRKQAMNIVIDNPQTEYIQLKINKCDKSTPSIQYTNDANEFKRGNFDAQVVVNENTLKQFIKTKKNSTIHLRLLGGNDDESLFTITASAISNQMRLSANRYRPGGLVQSEFLKDRQFVITFEGAKCQKQPCNSIFTYYMVISQDVGEVYSQINCAGSFFTSAHRNTPHPNTTIIVLNQTHRNKQTNYYRYTLKVESDHSYIGVKGVSSNYQYEVRYIPIQVKTIWGKLNNFPLRLLAMGALGTVLVLIMVIIGTTKLARRGYKPIETEQ